jgi:hypothetical protein
MTYVNPVVLDQQETSLDEDLPILDTFLEENLDC